MTLRTLYARKLIELALEEDLGGDDLTGRCTVSDDIQAVGTILAREPMLVCGLTILQHITDVSGFSLAVCLMTQDGSHAEEGDVLAEVRGSARDILALERTYLNFLQRLCGVATYTQQATEEARQLVILDTRKTMPGWRYLDKYATRIGGASNHRFHLSDVILIKDNHIEANEGSISKTLERVFNEKPYYTPVEIEVRSLKELREALDYPIDVVMLDNFSDDMIVQALDICAKEAPRVRIEVSGGIVPSQLPSLEQMGVHAVSMGALTTRARNMDISLNLTLK